MATEDHDDYEEDYEPADESESPGLRYRTPEWAPDGWLSGGWIPNPDCDNRWCYEPPPQGFSLEELHTWVVRQLENAHALVEVGFLGGSHSGAVAWNAYLLVDDLVQREPKLEPIYPASPASEMSLLSAIVELMKVRHWCDRHLSRPLSEVPPKNIPAPDWRQNIVVDLKKEIVTLKGIQYKVDVEVAAFVDALIKLEGQPRSFAKVAQGVAALVGQNNVTRLKKKIPLELLQVISIAPGSGCRLLVNKLQ